MGTTNTHFRICTYFHLSEDALSLQKCKSNFDMFISFATVRDIPVYKSRRPNLETTHPHIQRSSEALSAGLNHSADHLPPSSAKVKDECGYTCAPAFTIIMCTEAALHSGFSYPFSVVRL